LYSLSDLYERIFYFRTERNTDGSHSGRLAGSHRDSSRDIADQVVEKCCSGQQKSFVASAATLPLRKTPKKHEAEKLKEQPPILKYIKTQVSVAININ
jgi:hypothetical protein